MKVKSSSPKDTARERAIHLLARREHSQKELFIKLLQKGFPKHDIEPALEDLQSRGWLSDIRFAESWIRHRANRGYGWLRIKAELNEKGVGSQEIEEAKASEPINWHNLALSEWRKKFKNKPSDWNEKAKQLRFLQYRGFSADDIEFVFQNLEHN